MSNPLRMIRRYQKQMMVVFGVLLMLAFVVGASLQTATNPNRRNDEGKRDVVKWAGGKLQRRELDLLKQQHQLSQMFLQQLQQLALQAKGTPKVRTSLISVSNDPLASDREMMQILVLARKAEELGMVMSDAAIMQYLAMACDGELTEGDYAVLLDEMFSGQVSLMSVREHLKTELLAIQMESLLISGFAAGSQPIITPVAAYDYDARQFRTARCQLIPFEVEDYLDQVTDEPTRSELRKLYDEGRFEYPDLQGEDPGFRKPHQISIAWVKPNLTALKPQPGSITEEEIKQRYQQWEEDPSSPAWKVRPRVQENPTIDSGAEGETVTDAETTPPTTDDTSNSSDTNSSDTNSGDANSGDTSGDTTSGDTTSGDTTTGGDSGAGDDQSSINASDDQYQFVTTSVVVQDDSGQVKLPQAGAKPPQPSMSQPSTIPPTGVDPTSPTANPTTGLQTPELLPLEEVRSEIISELQEEKANAKAWEVIKKLDSDILLPANSDFIDWEIAVEDDEDLARPKPPAVEKFAKSNGLEYHSTDGLIPLSEFRETELGQYEIINIQYFQQFQSFPTLSMLIESQFDNLSLYSAEMVPDFAQEGGRPPEFIYWVVETKQPYSPEFEECEEDIVRFWKMKKARELAHADARKAVEAASSSKSFKDMPPYAGKVLVTDSFPWISVGGGNLPSGGGQLQISEIRVSRDATESESTEDSVDAGFVINDVGNDFMEELFSLKQGQAAAIPNAREQTYYAVYVVETGGMTPELLQEQVIRRRVADQRARSLASTEASRYYFEKLEELNDEMNIEWLE